APDCLLASPGTAPSVPHLVWPDRMAQLQSLRRPLRDPPSRERALGADDAGGARAIPAKLARALRHWPAHRRGPGGNATLILTQECQQRQNTSLKRRNSMKPRTFASIVLLSGCIVFVPPALAQHEHPAGDP